MANANFTTPGPLGVFIYPGKDAQMDAENFPELYTLLADAGRAFGVDFVEDLADSAREIVFDWLSDKVPAGVHDALTSIGLLDQLVARMRAGEELSEGDAHQLALIIPPLQAQVKELSQ